MTNTLLDLSGNLPPEVEAVLKDVAQILAAQGIAFFIVGALTRDLVLEHTWKLPPQRATKDIDFGVRVADWAEFERLKSALRQTALYTEHPSEVVDFLADGFARGLVLFENMFEGVGEVQ